MTTPECPKGPERGARPTCSCGTCQREAAARNASIPYLRRNIAEVVFDALDEWSRSRGVDPVHAGSDADKVADAVLPLVEPEVQRLTAEVERLNNLCRAIRTDQREELDDISGALGIRTGLPAVRIVHWARAAGDVIRDAQEQQGLAVKLAEAYKAEVSRLREQLAAQTLLPDNAEVLISQWLLDHNGTQYADYHETRPAARDLISFVLQWGIHYAAVESPTQAQEPLVHNVVLSSEEGTFGHWHVTCSCRESSEGDLAHAEFWKDQHLADTLTNESSISPQQAADELSRETQEVYRFDNPSARVSAVEGSAPPPSRLVSWEHLDGGRPSGSERLAPRSVEDEVRALLVHPAAWSGLVKWLDSRSIYVQPAGDLEGIPCWIMGVHDLSFSNVGVRYQCDWWSDDRRCPDWAERGGDLCRIHRAERERYDAETEQICAAKEQDAAQAAGSGATQEEEVADGYCDVCGCPMQYLHEPSCPELDSVPSPSLRKEGEDSDPDA